MRKKWDWKTQRRLYAYTNDSKRNAREGDAHSQYILAHRYFYGSDGIKQDYKEAVKWARSSAEKGHPDGQFLYSMCLAAGEGTEMDGIGAEQWRFVAAIAGHHVAQLTIGMKSITNGMTDGECMKWLLLSAESTDAHVKNTAFQYIDKFRLGISPDEIASAEQAVARWKINRLIIDRNNNQR